MQPRAAAHEKIQIICRHILIFGAVAHSPPHEERNLNWRLQANSLTEDEQVSLVVSRAFVTYSEIEIVCASPVIHPYSSMRVLDYRGRPVQFTRSLRRDTAAEILLQLIAKRLVNAGLQQSVIR